MGTSASIHTASCARYARVPPVVSCGDNKQQAPANPFQVVTTVTTQDVHPVRLSAVGNYALHIDWSDGHHTGIYPWDMLRDICPELRPAAPGLPPNVSRRLLAHQTGAAHPCHEFLPLVDRPVLKKDHPGVGP